MIDNITDNTAHKRRNSKQSNKNDYVLVEARMIKKFGAKWRADFHAKNLYLKMIGQGVNDNRVNTYEFCMECGWRVYFLADNGFRCSGCDRFIAPRDLKRYRQQAHASRRESLSAARIVTNETPKYMPYGTQQQADMNFR